MSLKLLLNDNRINWSIVDQFFVSGGNFLSVAFCANYLPLEGQGKLGYILAWYFGTIIINNSAIFQHASVKAPTKKENLLYLGKLSWMQLGLAIGVSCVFAVMVEVLTEIEGFVLSPSEVALFFGFLLAQQLADFLRRTAYIFHDSKRAAKLSCILYSTRVLLLFIIEPGDVSSVLIIFIATSLYSVFKSVYILLSMRQMFFNIRGFVTQHVKESKWFILSGPVIWLWSSLPIFLLGSLIDATAMAIFFTIRSMSNLGNVAMELLETEFSARLGKYQYHDSQKARKVVKHVRLAGAGVWVIGMLFILAFGNKLVGLIFGENYAIYSDLLILLWISNGVVFLYRLNAVYLRTAGRSNAVMKGYSLGVGVMIIAGVPLINTYGLFGSAGLVALGALVILFGQYWFSRSMFVTR